MTNAEAADVLIGLPEREQRHRRIHRVMNWVELAVDRDLKVMAHQEVMCLLASARRGSRGMIPSES